MLSKEQIVEAGRELVGRYGLADVSMRRVAEILGVQAGALYYHVPNKQTLLAGIAEMIVASKPAVDVGSGSPDWVSVWAIGLRTALLGCRDGAELVASAWALGVNDLDPAADLRARLKELGIAESEAATNSLLHFVLGHVITEQTRSQLFELGVLDEFDGSRAEREFSWGVSAFAAGLSIPRS